ncbi:MAG: penicillin acylase family protein [Acetobacteraceae bacterium]|nr:penicillin acylase family protein [Acetobacteraceae bacterium]
MLTWVGVLVLLMVCLVAGALWLTLPRNDQTAQIPGLSAPVEIGFDQDGIPRIHAATALDAAAALGFVHARDRMFQMELMRRNASGRLSEIAGPATLPLDRMMRTLGLRRHAVADLATLPPEARAMLEAYARGVNAWIAARGRFAAPEFLVLGAPEPWDPVDSLLWGKTMGVWLSSNWRTELTRLRLQRHVPQQMIDELWPASRTPPRPDAALVLPWRFAAAAERLQAMLPAFPAPFTLPSTASNEWAVDGSHTATGAPLLAGDPHLALGFPGIWYLARIETPGHVLAGATAPGIPFLVIGHNGHIAWTFTTTGADVQDIFVETPVGTGEYQTPDGPRPFAVHEERIRVRGEPDQVLTVRETRHGPVITDLLGANEPLLAVAMGNLQPDDTAAAGLLALNQAETVAQAGAAAPVITSPVQNLLVADRQGIGLFLTGRVPIRKAGDGSAPVPGADGAHDWIGWVAGTDLPHVVAPGSGRLVNTNEPIAPAEDHPFLGRDAFGDWRAQRIHTLLAASDRHTAADFAHIQADVQSTFAQQILPTLLAVTGLDAPAARAQALLRGWDGAMTTDAPQPLIFNAWIAQFDRSVLIQNGIHPDQGGPREDFVAFVLTPGGAHWCNGDCAPALKAALDVTVKALGDDYGADPAAWRWGTVHQAVFGHPILSRLPVLGPLTTLTIAAPGDDSTVDRAGTDADLHDVHGPGYRGVYDLADLDHSLFVMVPGQSGNILSRHARDFLVRWRDGATVSLGPLAARTEATLHLAP